LTRREITIPVSQIDRVHEDVVYLKLDRQSVEQLPTTPIQRWPEDVRDSGLERRIKMDKMLVVVFDSEIKAYEGSRALQELQNEGSINLYAKAVIARDAGGKVEVKQAGDMGPVGTAVGLLTGSLIGLIAARGLARARDVRGFVYDLGTSGLGFLGEVGRFCNRQGSRRSRSLGGLEAPVDTACRRWAASSAACGGNPMPIERDVAALDAELAELETKSDKASGEAQAKLRRRSTLPRPSFGRCRCQAGLKASRR
jgi:hypothetical protein